MDPVRTGPLFGPAPLHANRKETSKIEQVSNAIKGDEALSPPLQSGRVQNLSKEGPFDYQEVKFNEDELVSVQEKLQDLEAEIGVTVLFIEEADVIELSNGERLYPIEQAVVKFYTGDGFKLLNGSFNHPRAVQEFIEGRKIDNYPLDELTVIGGILSKVLASALNKLPESKESVVFRGSMIPHERIGEYTVGKVITQGKFSSVTTMEGRASQFASQNAAFGGMQTIYTIENPKKAKDVDRFSFFPKEKERIYAPNQQWEITQVFKEEVYETFQLERTDEIEEARGLGTLKSKEVMKKNGQMKTIYYRDLTEFPPQVLLRIHMKEI